MTTREIVSGANCPRHGYWPTGGNYCPQCGTAMEPSHNNCRACQHPIEPIGAAYCRHCGAEQVKPR